MRRCCEPLLMLCALAAGCGSCQKGPPSELEVEGPTPYVRCLAAEPPEAAEATVGDVTLARDGRDLTITGLPETARLVAFSGPGAADGAAEAIAALAELAPDLVLVLGDVGDDRARAEATLTALGALGTPALVLAGGRDDAVVWAEAWDVLEGPAAERVVDVTPYRRVRLGAHELVPVAGAPGGRYARTDQACGHGPDDLEEAAEDLGEPPAGQRLLVSWAAPTDWASGLEGADPGDPDLRELADAVGVTSGLYAWPPGVRAPEASETPLRLGVRPVAGPAVSGPHGGRAPPGATVLELGPEGLKISD